MFCIHCGSKIPDISKFCYVCGEPCVHTTIVKKDVVQEDTIDGKIENTKKSVENTKLKTEVPKPIIEDTKEKVEDNRLILYKDKKKALAFLRRFEFNAIGNSLMHYIGHGVNCYIEIQKAHQMNDCIYINYLVTYEKIGNYNFIENIKDDFKISLDNESVPYDVKIDNIYNNQENGIITIHLSHPNEYHDVRINMPTHHGYYIDYDNELPLEKIVLNKQDLLNKYNIKLEENDDYSSIINKIIDKRSRMILDIIHSENNFSQDIEIGHPILNEQNSYNYNTARLEYYIRKPELTFLIANTAILNRFEKGFAITDEGLHCNPGGHVSWEELEKETISISFGTVYLRNAKISLNLALDGKKIYNILLRLQEKVCDYNKKLDLFFKL